MSTVHTFKPGQIVTIFQMSPAKGLMIEGKAVIRSLVKDVDEQYVVAFGDEQEGYERFVDREGQQDPKAYVRDFNKRIGKAA